MIEYTNGSIKLTPTVFLEPGLLAPELCAQGGVVSPVTKETDAKGDRFSRRRNGIIIKGASTYHRLQGV